MKTYRSNSHFINKHLLQDTAQQVPNKYKTGSPKESTVAISNDFVLDFEIQQRKTTSHFQKQM
jgi:hypothetical protein